VLLHLLLIKSRAMDVAPVSSVRPASALASAGVHSICKPLICPESLHPSLWLGHQLGRHAESAIPSGFAPLDAQLPGGGWPRRALSELLLQHPGVGEIRLLAPSLVATQKAGRLVMLFDPPAQLSAGALAQLGFEVEQLLIINTRARVIAGADSLWALEQALKSGHVGAVLAWLPPRLRAERLRRLQLAAHAHDGPAFVLRETSAMQRPTAAPLRLSLRPNGPDMLAVRLLKRRGPLLTTPVLLSLPPILSAVSQLRANAAARVSSDPRQIQNAEVAAASLTRTAALRAATFVNLAAG
jgi:protein ImuA